MRNRTITLTALILALAALAGCAPGVTSFLRDDVDFSYIRTVAVYPFQNLSQDVHADQRLQSVFVSRLLARDAVRVVESGETLHVLARLRLGTDGELSAAQLKDLGKALGVDAVFFGTVQEYGVDRAGSGRVYAVAAKFSLLETETGSMIWNAETRATGSSFWRTLFGGGSASLYDISRDVVDHALGTLFR